MDTSHPVSTGRRLRQGLLALVIASASVAAALPAMANAAPLSKKPLRHYTGDRMTLFGDVTGDGKVDVVAVDNDGLFVSTATPSGPSPYARPARWTDIGYWGDRGTYLADVTGDGKADAIVQNDDFTVVRASTGTSFAPNRIWSTHPTGFQYFVDLSGDAKADGVTVDVSGVHRWSSLGDRFSPWMDDVIDAGPNFLPSPFKIPGAVTFPVFSDVNRDGVTDVVVQQGDSGTLDWVATGYLSSPDQPLSGRALDGAGYPCPATGCELFDFARTSPGALLDRVVVEPATNTIGYVPLYSWSNVLSARSPICHARWDHTWGDWNGDQHADFIEATPTRIVVHRNDLTSFTALSACPPVPPEWNGLQ